MNIDGKKILLIWKWKCSNTKRLISIALFSYVVENMDYGNLFFVCFDLFTSAETKITIGLNSPVNGWL